jgi:protein-S-isoprenylcysteine O-methyltransferase Ste14
VNPVFPRQYAEFVQKLRVPLGFLLLGLYVWLARPHWVTMAAGLPLALAGLWVRSWAAGHLRKNEKLTVSGPYAYMRNPLYLGTLLTAAGCCVMAGQLVLVLPVLAVFWLVYYPVMEREEAHLRSLFSEYGRYADQVPVMAMWGKRWEHATGERWESGLWRRNREWKGILGFLVAAGFLLVRRLLS